MAPYLPRARRERRSSSCRSRSRTTTASRSTSASGNYWGYVTDGYFAPDRHYACDRSLGGPTAEWKAMVRAFHDAGIEVWLDVVYNHTGEGGNWDATQQVAEVTSFRGFDNIDFYDLVARRPGVVLGDAPASATTSTSTTRGRTAPRHSTACATGRPRWASTASASTSPPSSAATRAPSLRFNPRAQLLRDIAALASARRASRSSPSRGTSAPTASDSSRTAGASGTAATATRRAGS